jgi:uncharacterized protein
MALFGHFQPPTRGTEVQRNQQAQVVHDFVVDLEAADEHANVVVLGALITTLPRDQRYTYDFEGTPRRSTTSC